MGDNGIFAKAEQSKLEYQIAKAREKLEVTFGQAKIPKHTDKKYNQDEYLDDLMKKEIPNIKIKEDIVIVDGYAFEIDRSEPKIGKYVGREEELVFPTVSTTVMLARGAKTATIRITAEEKQNGINKIEIIQEGHVIESYTYDNEKETITEDYIAKQNGIYVIKVYSKLTEKAIAEVDGIIMSVIYVPNGDNTYKQVHEVRLEVEETDDKVKSIKYTWTNTTARPDTSAFKVTYNKGETISQGRMTGTYYLWTLLETEKGNTRIERSNGFNFDNQAPIITLTSTPVSESSFTLTINAKDNYSKIAKYEFYVGRSLANEQETDAETANFTVQGMTMGSTNCSVAVEDELGNRGTATVTANTKQYTWEKWSVTKTNVYTQQSTSGSRLHSGTSYVSTYDSYSFDNSTGKFTGTRTS